MILGRKWPLLSAKALLPRLHHIFLALVNLQSAPSINLKVVVECIEDVTARQEIKQSFYLFTHSSVSGILFSDSMELG